MSQILSDIENRHLNPNKPSGFRVGDIVDVHVRIREGDKERVQIFSGTVIKIKGGGNNIRSAFTVRRIVSGEGVERVFPFHSPRIFKVEVTRPGKTRRAKLYFLRKRVGKATRVKERRLEGRESGAEAGGASPEVPETEREALATK